MINDEDFSDEQLLLTTVQAARLLGVGRTTVYALMKDRHLRPVHVGRCCRIPWSELERFIAQQLSDGQDTDQPSSPSTGRRVWRRHTDASGAHRIVALELHGPGDGTAA